jgi:hypothetical protein
MLMMMWLSSLAKASEPGKEADGVTFHSRPEAPESVKGTTGVSPGVQ